MNINQEENEKSNNILRKIKYNFNKNAIQPARIYSSFKQRPITSSKIKKTWKINKLISFDKTTLDIPYFGNTFYTSKYFSNKIYLKKNSFVWGKKKLKKPNKYFEKEELFDRVIKLQNTVNKLNNKTNKQKIEINKQKKEIKKQNKILNEVNTKFFFDKLLNDDDEQNYGKGDLEKKLNEDYKTINTLSKRRSYSTVELKENNFNYISNKLLNNLNTNNLKDLYKKVLKQNEIKEQEIIRLKEKIESIKFSNETFLSNIKLQYKQLQNDNNKKISEINELKKSSKCTKYNEIMKEKEIYEKEMLKIKNKFYKVLRVLQKYKNCFEENKILVEEINKKDIKINKLENEIILFSKNSENLIETLRKEINKKNKKIQKLENEIKKYNCLYNNIHKEDNKKINFYNKGFKLLFQNQNNNENNDNNINYNKKDNNDIKYENYNIENNNIENNNIENNNIENNNIENINIENNINQINNNDKNNNNEEIRLNTQNEKNDNNNDNKDDNKDDESNKNKNIFINHNLNFSNKINNIVNQSHSSHSSRANLFSASLRNINLRKEKINNIENNNILKNSRILEIINLYPELYQLFIEMKKRNINDNKTYINEVLMKLKEENSNIDNKNIYYNSIIKLFNIEDENSKKIIEILSNKEFEENKSLQEIKIHQIKLFNELYNHKRENNNKDILNNKLMCINIDEFNNIVNKYDNCESGYVFFNQMILIIKELKLEDYIEDILILTKESDIFDLMNYNNILDIITKKNESINKEENEEKEKKEEKNEEKDEKNEEKDLKDEKDEKDENNQKEEKDENNENNENLSLNDVENELKNQEEKENVVEDKIFKNLAHIILIEGSTPNAYISSLKESIKIGENDNLTEVIDPEKFFNFLKEKNITLCEEEKEEIINQNGIKIEDKYVYIDYEKIIEKIFDYMKNDEGISNDEDFMKNIKSMEIEGMD